MRRVLSFGAAVLNDPKFAMSGGKKKYSDFREWRFRDPPSYAELPIDENPDYNVPVAVKNAVFSKVTLSLYIFTVRGSS